MSSETPHEKSRRMDLEITVPDDVANGMYINLAMVNHSAHEFTLDFIYVQPASAGQSRAKATVRARVISSPQHTKRLLLALTDNVRRFERQFGEIALPEQAPGDTDAVH